MNLPVHPAVVAATIETVARRRWRAGLWAIL